jgi:hypothetical protein
MAKCSIDGGVGQLAARVLDKLMEDENGTLASRLRRVVAQRCATQGSDKCPAISMVDALRAP